MPRLAADHVLPLLIANADDPDLRRFLVVVRWQGWRASETLGLRWDENVDLAAGEFRFRIPTAKTWKQIAMADEVLEQLSTVPVEQRTDKVFRWSSYQSMHFHLRKLCTRLKVTWTPHMARH